MDRDHLEALHGTPMPDRTPAPASTPTTSAAATRRLDPSRLSNRIDLASVRLLGAVCETGSIARAADSEALTPSAISKRIKELEDLFGLPLLVRRREGVVPTAAGRIVAGVWGELEPILRSLPDRVFTAEAPADDSVRMLCDTRVARFVAIDRLGRAQARPVAGRVRLFEVSASRLADSLGELDADLGVLQGGRDEEAADGCPSSYRAVRVHLPASVCVTRDEHPLAGQPRLGTVDLSGFPIVLAPEAGVRAETLHAARDGADLLVETAPWSRSLGDALERLDTEPCRHVLIAPSAVRDRMHRFPHLRAIECSADWSTLRLTVLRRDRARRDVDEVMRVVFDA